MQLSLDRPIGRCFECGNVYKMDYIGPDPHAHHDEHGMFLLSAPWWIDVFGVRVLTNSVQTTAITPLPRRMSRHSPTTSSLSIGTNKCVLAWWVHGSNLSIVPHPSCVGGWALFFVLAMYHCPVNLELCMHLVCVCRRTVNVVDVECLTKISLNPIMQGIFPLSLHFFFIHFYV